MTRSGLVLKNLLRNRRRTLLTVASVAVSICLLAAFGATYRYLDAPPTPGPFNLVLMVTPRTSMMVPLPLHYQDRIAGLPGVAAISPVNMVDGYYGGLDSPLWAVACNPQTIFQIYDDWQIPEDQRRAALKERTALIVGRKMAEKHGWKVGDRIHLRSPNYHVSLDLVLRGIYSSRDDEIMLYFHWDYLNEVQGRPDTPGGFWVLAETLEDAQRLPQEIDLLFRNNDIETRTQAMKQFVLDFLGMLGNVKLILLSVSSVVVFAILLIVANTMGMSIRERTAELAVLRALGFRTQQVLGLLVAESLVLSLSGAAVGCAAAAGLFALTAGYQVGGAMPLYIQVDGPTLALTLAVAVGIAVTSTVLPAYRASRANIARALRFVG